MHHGPHLLNISLSVFSGNREDWESFQDLYFALVHDDSSLTDVQKLYYLKSHIQGEAKAVVDTLQLTGDNYSIAWALMGSRFEHTRLLVQDHIMAIQNIKPLREESAASVQKLLDTLAKHQDQLRALEQRVYEWDIWMISFAATGMDSLTRRAWEDELERLEAGGASESETVATFATLSSFLQRRDRSLTSVESLSTERLTSNRPPAPTSASLNYGSLATQANDVDTECAAC
ncbi:uncharacterized protein LOC111643961 [Copidosoma floridanum]|uniref:uncharacterized protein LOC111643961 n=1 Tax=Copidosoma floridanum TaxID=29053 RepID=UPI000C6FB6BC|nr:uncharacterized protein LOC111643961 [Copidosoma floridanum]